LRVRAWVEVYERQLQPISGPQKVEESRLVKNDSGKVREKRSMRIEVLGGK